MRFDPREDHEQQQGDDEGDEEQGLSELRRERAGQVAPDPDVHQACTSSYSACSEAGILRSRFGTFVASFEYTIIRCDAVNFGWQVVIVISACEGATPSLFGT